MFFFQRWISSKNIYICSHCNNKADQTNSEDIFLASKKKLLPLIQPYQSYLQSNLSHISLLSKEHTTLTTFQISVQRCTMYIIG